VTTRRKWAIPALVTLIVLALIVGVVYWFNNSTGDSDAAADADKPLAVTRQVERRTLRRELQVTGTIERIEVQTISVATQGNISDIAIDDGDRIEVGDEIFSLDGRPGIAVQGETPFFRDLDVGSRGNDVKQLEEALSAFGYNPGEIDTLFSLDTRRALAQYQSDNGYPASAPEVGETITVSLGQNPSGYTVGAQNTASITIDPLLTGTPDDDVVLDTTGLGASVGRAAVMQAPVASISTTNVVVDEGDPVQFTVALSAPAVAAVNVGFVVGGSAGAGTDYAAPINAMVAIPTGDQSATFSLQTIEDATAEGTEDLTVTLQAGVGYTVAASPGDATRTDIVDDDVPTFNITSSGSVVEGGSGGFTITATQAPLNDTTVTLITPVTAAVGGGGGAAATSGTDYSAFQTVAILPAGQTSVTVPITTLADTDVEGDEEIVVEIEAAPGYLVGSQNAALLIITDATTVSTPTITIESDNDENAEAAANAPFTVTADVASVNPYDISYAIGGTAAGDIDYEIPTNAVVTMPANATQVALNVALIDDDDIETDRTVSVSLIGGADYVLGTPSTDQTIIGDDDAPELNVAGTVTINEGSASVVTITADQPAREDISIPITIGGTATSNADYEPVASTVQLPAGSTTTTVTIQTLPDTTIEPTEEITVTLGGGGDDFTAGDDNDATITVIDAVGTGTGPVLTINSSAHDIAEGQSIVFTIGASVPSSRDIDVNVSLGGSARNTEDYTFPTQDLILPAGQTSISLQVQTRQNDFLQGDRDITLQLLGGVGYSTAEPTVAHTHIKDDDLPELTLTGGGSDLAEGQGASFVIRADQAPMEPVSVNYQVSGSAQPGSDFETLSGTVILAAGQREVIIPIQTLNDDVTFRPTDMIAAEWPGRAGKVFIEEGQSLVDGAPLFEITEDEFSIRLNLSPNQRAQMAVGMVAEVEIDASDISTVGDITEIDENATIGENGGETYEGRVDISSEFAAVDGSAAQVTVVVEEAIDAIVVPVAAPFEGPDGDTVRAFVDGELTEVPVVLGLDEDSFVEVIEGLNVGDLVIIEVN